MVSRQRNDDDDKKKSGGSSSASSSSSSNSQPTAQQANSYAISLHVNTAMNGAPSGTAIGTTAKTTPVWTSSSSSRWGNGWKLNFGSSGSSGSGSSYSGGSSGSQYGGNGGYQTRGSSAYNQSRSAEPQNATQALSMSTAERFGINGLKGIGNGRPDIRGDKWFAGDTPTSMEIAARILAFDPNNQDAINEMWRKRFTQGDETYSAYAAPTSQAVYKLQSLGVQFPEGGVTREWCEQALSAAAQSGLLNLSSTSGNATSKKRASKDETITYWIAKLYDDLDRTEKAEREWAAFKEDVMHKAGDTSRNWSNEQIYDSLDWSKYPTLRKALEDGRSQQPSEFVRALDFDMGYFDGLCWAGRNGGGSGDAFTDTVNYILGEGNQYQYDPDKAAKFDINNPEYDPYSQGGTMYNAQLFFGTYDLGDDFVNSHKDYGVSSDSTMSGNYFDVVKANDFTRSCNEELASMKGEVDDWLEDYLKYPNSDPPSDEDITELLNDIFQDNTDYRSIQKLNDSLDGKRPLENTTGVIGTGDTVGLYKRSNLERYIREKLADRASNVDPHDAADETGKGLGGAMDNMYSTLGNFFTGLFGPKEQYVPKDENGNPVEVKPEPSKAHVQSFIKEEGPLTASATVSDVGGALAARPTPTPFPGATPSPEATSAPAPTPAGPTREDWEGARKDSYAAQQEALQKRQNMANGTFSLRDVSTPTEKQTYKTTYPEFDEDVATIKDGIENGGMSEQQSYDSMVQAADALAAKTYFSDVETIEAHDALGKIIAEEEAQLAGMPDVAGSTMPMNPQTGEPMTEDELATARLNAWNQGDAETLNYLAGFGGTTLTDEQRQQIANRTAVKESLEQHKAQYAAQQEDYDAAQDRLKDIDAKYNMADEMAADGVETGLGIRATDIMDAIRNGFGEVKLPDWNAWSVYDYAERSGEYSQEEIAAAAKENIAKDDDGIAQIQGVLDMVDQYGLNIPERYRANMEETLRQYQENKKDSQYYLLRTNPDFAEKVAEADSEELYGKERFHTGSSIGYALYAFKHGTKDRQLYAQYPLMGEMSQEELDTALYLLETQGPITADEYYLHLGDSQYGRLNTRFTEDAVQQAVGIAKGSAVGGTLLSVAMAPLNSTGSFQIIFDKVTGRKSNPNSILSAGQKASAAMRQEAKGQIVGAIADPFGGADSAVGKVAGFVYDGITSAGDTAANLAVGKALGIVGTPLDNKLKVSAMNMATAAGTSSYNEAIQKGGTEEQATMMGIASFMGEWLTEAIEMTDIMDAISTGASEAADGAVKGIKAFLKKQIPELGNEIVGESVSDVIERVSDEAIMGELSDKAKAVEGYTQALLDADPNMSEQLARSEAEYQAKLDGWKSTAYAGLQGGFSAGISTTGGYVAGNFATTTDQFLRTFAVQRGLEAQGLPKANARVAARNIVAVGADNTTVYGPQLNAELAENEAQMAAEEAAAEDLKRRTHEFAEDLNSDAAREEQNNLRQANAEQQTTEAEQPTSEEQNNTATAIRSTRQVATSEQSRANRAEFSRRMFALEQGSMGGATQQVVAITSVLDQGETSSDELTTAQARAAAQGLVETFGDRATSVIQRLMMKARNEGVDYGALAQAVQVAGLTDGAANQAFAGLQPWGISTENFNAFMQAANADMADQAIRDQMRKRTYDVMVATEKARLISDGAAKDLQAAAERKQEARKRRQHAQEQHEAKVREVEAASANFNRTNEEFDNGIDGDTENALRDTASDLPGAIIAERQLAQSEESAIANETKVNKEVKAQQEAINADLTRQAQEAVDRKLKAAYATRDRRSAITAAQGQARTGNSGTVFVNPKTKISFHYAIVPVEALVTSNTDNGGVNPDYPAKLQPRDRTRYSSRVDLENMANGGLTPELLGADNRVQHGAPVVGPDFIVESGNQRTMGIRKAMQNGKADGYTEWLRTNAENFGFAPDVVTDNSVLVRVRDTDIDRVAFAREANTVDMAKLSPSETAAVDADMLTPERMALFVPNDDGRVDNEDNREFVRMYRQEIIPEYERGSYQNDKGENANDLYNRIKRGLFNRAYHDRILTAAVTESTGDEVKNVMTAMTNVAPKVALVADGIANGNLYDLDVTQNIVDAAKLIRDIRRDGISLDERLNQGNMFEEGIDPTTAAIAQMFDTNKRSGTKITRALNNILDDIINLGAPDQVRLDGMEMTEAPDKAQFVQSSLNRTNNIAGLESQGAVEGQTSMLGNDTATEETQADGTIQASNIGAPNPTVQSQSTEPIKSGYDIILDLEKATGIKIDNRRKKYLRSLRKKTKGYTAKGRDIVHIQDADDVETAAHEIGHKIADDFNLLSSAPTDRMVQYLENHKNPDVRSWIKGYKPEVRPGEAIAEFCKYWMLDRDAAIEFAGEDFVNDWENKLASRNWLAPMQQAAQDLRLNRAANSGERALASIVMETDRKAPITANEAFEGIFDDTLPLLGMEVARKRQEGGDLNYRASLDPRTLRLQMNSGIVENTLNTCLTETMIDPQGRIVRREDGTEWGSLKDITGDIPTERARTFAALWELLNAKDRAKFGKSVFAEDINIDDAYNRLAKGNEDLVEKIHQVHDWWNQFMRVWVVGTGNLGANGQAIFDKMTKMYPNYAPALRPSKEQTQLTSSRQYRMGENAAGVMRAHGGTTPVLDPILGISQLAQRYISNYKTVELLRAVENTSRTINGYSWLLEPAQKDMVRQNEQAQNATATQAVLGALEKLGRLDNVDIDQDTLTQAMDAVEKVMDNLPDFSYLATDPKHGDVITFPDENGNVHSYTVYDHNIFQALMYTPPDKIHRVLQALGNVVRTFTSTLSMNATSRKLTFPIMNAESDAETAYVTGKSGLTPIDYAFNWFRTAGYQLGQVVDDATGKDVDERYRMFKLFGKYGSRFSIRDQGDQIALRKELFQKGKKTAGEVALTPITLTGKGLEELSGFLEDNTRLNEHNSVLDILANNESLTDYDKELIAARAGHEASTDFKKRGSISQMRYAKAVIPFFNGQLQGLYKTIRMFSSENEGNRKKIAMRLTCQGLMTALVPAILRSMLLPDDEKKEYDLLTPYERNKYHHVKIGNRWVRIKKSQDGIIQMTENVGEVLGDLLTGYEGDELGDLYNLATAVASNLVLSLDTSLDPISDALSGTTWSGRSMVGYELQGMSVTEQYNASTTHLARLLSHIPFGDKQISPAGWDYMIKQYFGGLGSFGYEMWDALLEDGDKADNVLYAIRNHFASALSVDPVYSNTLANNFTSSKNMMAEAIAEAKGGHSVAHFRPGLTQSQVDRAIKEARDLTSSKGKIGKINSKLSDLWKKHESILNDTKLTKDEREKRAREVRIQINEQYLQGSEIMNDYWIKYGFKNKSAENFSNFVSDLGEFFAGEQKKVPKYKKK